MYNIILSLHNLLRWIILILLIVNLIRHIAVLNKPFTEADKKLGLWLMIAAQTTFLLGIYQWFAGAYGYHNISNIGMGAVMQNTGYRFYAIEHTVGMIVSVALVTVARGVFRKNISDRKKHIRCVILYALALIIILALIPWPEKEQVGRPLFRNF
jgi:hypothetical protein